MRSTRTKLAAGISTLVALALGGSALASATGKAAKQTPGPPVAASVQAGASAADGDNVQEGDQTSPDPADTADTRAGAAAEQASESASEQQGPDAPDGPADEAGSADVGADSGK